jgi:hypothetical protein
MALKATVRNGRFVIDEPTGLPEGTVLDLVVDDEEGELSESELKALNAAIASSLEQGRVGKTAPVSAIIKQLRDRHRNG